MDEKSATEASSWHRRERRAVKPYPTSERSLRQCGFALSEDQPTDSQIEQYYVDRAVLEGGLRPKFWLDLDSEGFAREAGRSVSDVEVFVVARDSAARDYSILGRFAPKELPRMWRIPDSRSNSEGVDFSIMACLAESSQVSFGRAHRKGAVLARRSFLVKPLAQGPSFPIAPEALGDGSLWRIAWIEDADYNEKVDSILEVRIDDKAFGKLKGLFALESPSSSILARVIASQIFEAIARRVLGSEDITITDDEGLAGTLRSKLSEVTGYQPEVLMERLKEDEQLLQSGSQALYGLAKTIASATV